METCANQDPWYENQKQYKWAHEILYSLQEKIVSNHSPYVQQNNFKLVILYTLILREYKQIKSGDHNNICVQDCKTHLKKKGIIWPRKNSLIPAH